MGSRFRGSGIPLAVQSAAIKSFFPSFRVVDMRPEEWRWDGSLQPTAISAVYRISIRYRLGQYPEVRVISPSLQRRNGEYIPHMYNQDRLCLYLPDSDEWHRGLLLAKTIIPWASLWLSYYEAWLATGTWKGGGVHPGATEEKVAS